MTWVIWRQHRQQAIVAFATLGALIIFFAITGTAMSHTFHSSGLASCFLGHGDCGDLASAFDAKYGAFQIFEPLFLALPALVGLFFGAPLIARELEQGTYRFAWTQSVSRRHWAIAKLTGMGAATLALAAVFAGAVSWWSSTILEVHSEERFTPGIFDLRGLVPIGYMVFAVALGITLGYLTGKVLAAMGATLVGFTAVRVFVTAVVRQRFLPPEHSVSRFGSAPLGSWVLSQNTLDRAGHVVARGGGLDFKYLTRHCPNVPTPGSGQPIGGPILGKDLVFNCVQKLGLKTATTFQPLSRFWTFQWIEFGIYMGLTIALLGFVVWRINIAD